MHLQKIIHHIDSLGLQKYTTKLKSANKFCALCYYAYACMLTVKFKSRQYIYDHAVSGQNHQSRCFQLHSIHYNQQILPYHIRDFFTKP